MRRLPRVLMHRSAMYAASTIRSLFSSPLLSLRVDSISAEAASAKITSQWSIARKAALADTVIPNDGTLPELHQRLEEWYFAHVTNQEKQAVWKNYVPTVPTLLLTVLAAPMMIALTYVARGILL
jgi:hypothetical protein